MEAALQTGLRKWPSLVLVVVPHLGLMVAATRHADGDPRLSEHDHDGTDDDEAYRHDLSASETRELLERKVPLSEALAPTRWAPMVPLGVVFTRPAALFYPCWRERFRASNQDLPTERAVQSR